MASTLLGAPFNSGAQLLVSGNFWSGQGARFPTGGIQLQWDITASGPCYVYMSGGGVHPNSGGCTITSGGMFLSGAYGGVVQSGGYMDGMKLVPGQSYFIPRLAFISGQVQVCAFCDPNASGQGRMWWEIF